ERTATEGVPIKVSRIADELTGRPDELEAVRHVKVSTSVEIGIEAGIRHERIHPATGAGEVGEILTGVGATVRVHSREGVCLDGVAVAGNSGAGGRGFKVVHAGAGPVQRGCVAGRASVSEDLREVIHLEVIAIGVQVGETR